MEEYGYLEHGDDTNIIDYVVCEFVYVNNDRRLDARSWVDIKRSKATPRNLIKMAECSGAFMVLCPSKYGCRQFVNPDFEKK